MTPNTQISVLLSHYAVIVTTCLCLYSWYVIIGREGVKSTFLSACYAWSSLCLLISHLLSWENGEDKELLKFIPWNVKVKLILILHMQQNTHLEFPFKHMSSISSIQNLNWSSSRQCYALVGNLVRVIYIFGQIQNKENWPIIFVFIWMVNQ